jgi:hypothetical protein
MNAGEITKDCYLLNLIRDDVKHPLYSLVAVDCDLIEAYEIDHEPLTMSNT